MLLIYAVSLFLNLSKNFLVTIIKLPSYYCQSSLSPTRKPLFSGGQRYKAFLFEQVNVKSFLLITLTIYRAYRSKRVQRYQVISLQQVIPTTFFAFCFAIHPNRLIWDALEMKKRGETKAPPLLIFKIDLLLSDLCYLKFCTTILLMFFFRALNTVRTLVYQDFFSITFMC